MSEGIIVRRGGKAKDVFAFIVVTYPVGSTLTATKGSKVLTAGDTTGTWVFEIPEAEAWTIFSTDGTETTEKNIIISIKGQIEEVKLSYLVPIEYVAVEYLLSSGKLDIQGNLLQVK